MAAVRKSRHPVQGQWVLAERYSASEATFAADLVKKTPVTAEVIASARVRAGRTRAARSAHFLDKYRAKAA